MVPFHEITRSLPPERDDEPPSLRQDIVDEIVDHLQCSLRRELLVGSRDEVSALQQVLLRFGNPDQVARRLWFQAMWSRIMTGRLVIGSTIGSVVVSVSMIVMVGWMVQQMQQQQRDQQQFNAAMMDKITALISRPAAATESASDPKWNLLTLKLTSGSKDGPPAEINHLTILRETNLGERETSPSREYEGNSSGICDLGYVMPGTYQLTIISKWHERARVSFHVRPGKDHVEQIVIPDRIPELAKITLDVKRFPDRSRRKNQVLMIELAPLNSRTIAGVTWSTSHWGFVGDTKPYLMVVPNHGVWMAEVSLREMFGTESYAEDRSLPKSEIAMRARWEPLDPSHEFQVPANKYCVSYSLVGFMNEPSTADRPDQANWRKSLRVTNELLGRGEKDEEGRLAEFVADPGKPSHWTITLPDDVYQRLNFANE